MTRRFVLVGGMIGALVLLVAYTGRTTPMSVSAIVNDDGLCATATNLLQNPSFEGTYTAYEPPGGHPDCPLGICNSVRTAAGWTPWWTQHNSSDPGYIIKQPEFTAADSRTLGQTRHLLCYW